MASVFDLLDQARSAIATARAQAASDAAHHLHTIKQWEGIVDSLRDERREMASTISRLERAANVRAANAR